MSSQLLSPTTRYTSLSPFLVSWTVRDPIIRTDLTSTALLTLEGWWLIDPVPITDHVLDRLLGNQPLLGILLTNENHERASNQIAQKRTVPIHAHEVTLGRLEVNPTHFFRDGDILKGNLHILHIPGPSLGESCFYDPQNQVLVIGDALINLKETNFTFLPDKYCHDPVQAKNGLKRLLNLEFNTIVFAHGPPLTMNAKNQFKALLDTSLSKA